MTTIRQATASDIDCCDVILDHAKDFLRAQDLSQWQWGYPNRQNLVTDVANGELFVACDDETGEILGSAMITMRGETNYGNPLRGAWITRSSNGPGATYACIHRVTCAPEYRGRGIATSLMEECERQARACGKRSCRVETHPNNASMRHIAEKLGYVHCCDIASRHDQIDGRVAYEKLLVEGDEGDGWEPLADDRDELQRLVSIVWMQRRHAGK